MFCPAQSCERLCWRPWPCSKCSGGVTPIGHVFRCIDSGAQVSATSPEEIAAIQAAQLQAFARSCNHGDVGEVLLPKLAEGSEHLVFLDAANAKVFKLTRKGMYGELYYLVNNLMHQRNCAPVEYLLRLRIWKKIFQSAPRDIGITDAGQIVSTHEFVTGTEPTQESVNAFLERAGLKPVRNDCWVWKREYPEGGFDIWLGDARRDNFVEAAGGIVPIDIRMWQA